MERLKRGLPPLHPVEVFLDLASEYQILAAEWMLRRPIKDMSRMWSNGERVLEVFAHATNTSKKMWVNMQKRYDDYWKDRENQLD